MKYFLSLLSALLLGAGCAGSETWLGFYYPDSGDLTVYQTSGELESLDECRDWVDEQNSYYNPYGTRNYDYECGSNCQYNSDYDMYSCDETVD